MASAALGDTLPCDDGMTSCGFEGSSISALCFGSFECVAVGVGADTGVGMGLGMGFGEGTANLKKSKISNLL